MPRAASTPARCCTSICRTSKRILRVRGGRRRDGSRGLSHRGRQVRAGVVSGALRKTLGRSLREFLGCGGSGKPGCSCPNAGDTTSMSRQSITRPARQWLPWNLRRMDRVRVGICSDIHVHRHDQPDAIQELIAHVNAHQNLDLLICAGGLSHDAAEVQGFLRSIPGLPARLAPVESRSLGHRRGVGVRHLGTPISGDASRFFRRRRPGTISPRGR